MASDIITLAHGAGGSVMQSLIKQYILKHLGGANVEVPLTALDDAAVVDGIVLKSDSYTVKPIFFPGGDIGRLAICGTVNDICMIGGEPLALAEGFILEEGLSLSDFDKILLSMRKTCDEAGVPVVTGDTKVMERGALEKIVINSSGIGRRNASLDHDLSEVRQYRNCDSQWLLDSNVRRGDKIILSGTIGDHGISVLSAREGYGFETRIESDAAPLNRLTSDMLQVGGIVAMKDPTRGGLANLLNEWSEKSHVGILLHEQNIPIKEGVRSACEMLGLDVMEIGNEGKVVAAVVPEKVEDVLAVMRRSSVGKEAIVIGEATSEFEVVAMETVVGGRRIIPPPAGDPVPRIC
ncbi:MAG TPA: hydrogenase expression/formation protein HypE [Candidatus Bathyarchaeia archaeon]|nr:hydrogenase expression/formation protein HypE [Candidatus Bathyarchaeia archaeon]